MVLQAAPARPVRRTEAVGPAGADRPDGVGGPAEVVTPSAGGPRPPRWPLAVVFGGYPVVWVLGFGPLALPLLTGFCLLWLLRHRRRLLAPRATGLWFAFLVWLVISLGALDLLAPGTVGGGGFGATLAFAYRAVMYLSATALMVYLVSTTEQEVPARLVVRSLGWLFFGAVVGGYLGLLLPTGGFTSPVERLLPQFLVGNSFVRELVHPSFAQVQDVLGVGDARPSAPFTYTNEWGSMVAYLLPAFVVDRLVLGRARERVWGAAVLVLSVVPVVLSLNRGLWLSLALAGAISAFLVVRRRPRLLAPLVASVLVAGAAFLASPFGSILEDRASSEHSLSARGFIYEKAIDGALASPLVGWGGPRQPEGNPDSRVSGESVACPKCSPPSVGTHGQLWLVSFSHGIFGALLFFGYFVRAWFQQLRPPDAIAALGLVYVSIWFLQMFFYPGVPWPVHLVLALVALRARGALTPAGGHPRGTATT